MMATISKGDDAIKLGISQPPMTLCRRIIKEVAKEERVKARRMAINKTKFLVRCIKIGALIDALMLVNYLGWKTFSFFAPVAEPQVKLGENVLRLMGLL